MCEIEAERTAYHRSLYQKSVAHRIARINHTRRRRGMPLIDDLSQVRLRKCKTPA